MSQHVVWVKHFGYSEKQEIFTFNANKYTQEDVESMFVPYQFISQKGFEQTGYEYNGEQFYKYRYLGIFPDDKIPKSNDDLWEFEKNRLNRY